MSSNVSDPLIAVLDVGKTNAKLSLVDPSTAAEVWNTRRANTVVDTDAGRELDVHGIEHWLLDALRTTPQRDRIACIVPIAHGAAAVLLDASGNVIAAPDYEDSRCEGMNAQYARQRDAFADTYSPSLPSPLSNSVSEPLLPR